MKKGSIITAITVLLVPMMARNWDLVKTGYKCFMADRELIEIEIANCD